MANSSKPGHWQASLALLLIVPAPAIGVLMAMWISPGAIGQTIWGLSKAWMLGMPLLWWLYVERGRISFSPMRQGGFAAGMISGLVICAAIIGGYFLIGRSLIDHEQARQRLVQVGITSMPLYVGVCLYWIVVNSVLEEYVWRWFVYRQLEAVLGEAHHLVVLSAGLAFTHHHVYAVGFNFSWQPTVVIIASLGVLVGGVTWSYLYAHYRSIWPGWISHAWADLGVFVVGGIILFG